MNKQRLIILSGSPCVGKSAAADMLFQRYENSAYLDGDWCWCVNPFSVSDPRLRNGDRSMAFVLANYLTSDFDTVVFSSVVAMYETIREPILENVRKFSGREVEVYGFTLTCSEDTLSERHRLRGDDNAVSFHWLHLAPYPGDHVIVTDHQSVSQVVDAIQAILDPPHEKR